MTERDTTVNAQRVKPDLVLQSGLEQFQQQIFLALIRRVVVQRQDRRLHELSRATRRQSEDETRQVRRIRLKQVEQVLIGLQAVAVGFTQRLESAVRPCTWLSNAVCLQLLVLADHILKVRKSGQIVRAFLGRLLTTLCLRQKGANLSLVLGLSNMN